MQRKQAQNNLHIMIYSVIFKLREGLKVMQIKSVEIRRIPSATGFLLSLANSFNLRKKTSYAYELPGNDKEEIASCWNDVGKELQIALDEYGKRYDEGYYRTTTPS